jgi:hypothetical protein
VLALPLHPPAIVIPKGIDESVISINENWRMINNSTSNSSGF